MDFSKLADHVDEALTVFLPQLLETNGITGIAVENASATDKDAAWVMLGPDGTPVMRIVAVEPPPAE